MFRISFIYVRNVPNLNLEKVYLHEHEQCEWISSSLFVKHSYVRVLISIIVARSITVYCLAREKLRRTVRNAYIVKSAERRGGWAAARQARVQQ